MDTEINIEQIKKRILHRHPFLLIDKVIAREPGKKCVAIKNLTYNEFYFQGHFEEFALVPGVLLLESMAQTAGMVFGCEDEENRAMPRQIVLSGIEKAKFRKPGRPGDQLVIHSEFVSKKSFLYVFDCKVFVKDHKNKETLSCTATIKLAEGNF